MSIRYKKGNPIATEREYVFRLTSTVTGLGVPGQTFSGSDIQIRQAGASLVDAANSASVSPQGSGLYVLTLATSEIATPGPLLLRIVKAGAMIIETVEWVDDAQFGTVQAGTLTTTSFTTDLTQGNDYWNDVLIKMRTGSLAGQLKRIGDFANSGGLITLKGTLAFSAAPTAGNVFEIINS